MFKNKLQSPDGTLASHKKLLCGLGQCQPINNMITRPLYSLVMQIVLYSALMISIRIYLLITFSSLISKFLFTFCIIILFSAFFYETINPFSYRNHQFIAFSVFICLFLYFTHNFIILLYIQIVFILLLSSMQINNNYLIIIIHSLNFFLYLN